MVFIAIFMKKLFYISAILFTTISFGQSTGLIVGKIMDNEVKDAPLVLADVSIKNSEIKASTDKTGLFILENLEAGDYTLVCSFLGYETKEVDVHVDTFEPAELKLSLAASTISLDDLALLMATANTEDKATSEQ